jgi:hypothetical protein
MMQAWTEAAAICAIVFALAALAWLVLWLFFLMVT